MAFSDAFFVLIAGFALIITVWALDLTFKSVMDSVGPELTTVYGNNTYETNINTAWDNTTAFYNSSFAAMYVIASAISIGLTIFLRSHPLILVAWIFFNIVFFFLWDSLVDVMDAIAATTLNTGVMDDALLFFTTDIPRVAMLVNVCMAAVFLGKRVVE